MNSLQSLNHFQLNGDFSKDLVDLLPFPIIIAQNKNGVPEHIFFNKQFINEIGYTLSEIPTISDWYLKAYPNEEYRNETVRKWNELLQQAKTSEVAFATMEAKITTKRFGELWFEVKVSRNENTYFVAFVNIQEIIYKTEKLKQIGINKDKMLSILSHDIRGPIGNLYSLSKMTLSHDLNQEEFIELLKDLNLSTLRVLDLVETTVQWARSNFDKINIKSESVYVLKIVDDVLDIYKNNFNTKALNIKIDIDKNTVIKTDLLILNAILRNIVSNAIKFTPLNGKIYIQSDGKSISVSDTGVGMDNETIKRILNNNYSSSSGTQKEKGIGIGFKLIRDLIDKIDAKIDILSEPNVGTTIIIEF